MKRPLISALLAVGAAILTTAPTFADYYIMRESLTAPCKVVDSRPLDSKTIVGGDRTYTNRAAAEKQLPLLCKSE
jgi:histidinol-phosphate/aromatic aminotransferase/cobyric acid decarboxylase-like protein